MVSIWLPLLLLLPVLLLLKKVIESKKNHPPGPPGLPIIGNLHQLGPLPHRTLQQLSKKYGPVMRLKLGGVPTVIVSSPETAKEILKVHDTDCCSRPRLLGLGKLSYNYLDVAFSPFGEYWREMRKMMVLELFSNRRVQSFRFIREEEVGMLMNTISQSASSKTPVDLSEKLLLLTANVICRVAFGGNFEDNQCTQGKFQEKVDEAIAMLGSFSASDFFPYVGWIVDKFTGLYSRLDQSFNDLDEFLQKAVDQHLAKKEGEDGPEDLIDVLLKIEREQGQSSVRITKDHIKAILSDVFLAGIDTSAITTTWAMTELIRHPRVLRKVQAEIRERIGKKGRVSEEDIDELQYLKLVIKETWRLHAPGPLLIPREVMNPFKINGYNIYPKTRVQVNVWAIGRDPNVWKDPLELIPERFADNPIDYKGTHFELLPFGGGRRGCPGMNLGNAMVELILANLLYRFDWELPDGMKIEDIDLDEAPGLTVHKKIPLKLVPIDTLSS